MIWYLTWVYHSFMFYLFFNFPSSYTFVFTTFWTVFFLTICLETLYARQEIKHIINLYRSKDTIITLITYRIINSLSEYWSVKCTNAKNEKREYKNSLSAEVANVPLSRNIINVFKICFIFYVAGEKFLCYEVDVKQESCEARTGV